MAETSSPPVSEPLYFRAAPFEAHHGSQAFHGFFGRQGGVSTGIYDSLNCGPGSDDDPENVAANRALVAGIAGTAPERVLSLYQVHGDRCLDAAAPWGDERPQGDGFVTDRPGLALGILTADCAPVLFYGETAAGKPVIGAAHAGWRGALGGILDSTLAAMKDKGAENVSACVGPCIGRRSYEVSEEFFAEFIKQDEENERFFGAAARAGHHMFDLPGYCANRLAGLGLSHVYIQGADTFAEEAHFFSYRRTTHRKEPDYGRQISLIMIR